MLRQKIELLKKDRAAICLPKPSLGAEAEVGLRTGQQAGARARVADAKKEKASLFYELVAVRVRANKSWESFNIRVNPALTLNSG